MKRSGIADVIISSQSMVPFFLEAEMLSMPESLQHLGCGPQILFVVYTHLGYCEEQPVDWTQALLHWRWPKSCRHIAKVYKCMIDSVLNFTTLVKNY